MSSRLKAASWAVRACQGLLESSCRHGSLTLGRVGAATASLTAPHGAARLADGVIPASSRSLTTALPARTLPTGLAIVLQPHLARHLHAPSWHAAQQNQPQPVREEPPQPRPVAPLHPAGRQATSLTPGPARAIVIPDFADAEECDEAIQDLEKTRKRVSALRSPPPGHVPLKQRIKTAVTVAASFTKSAAAFSVSVPGRVARFAALPSAERSATYARWWCAIKREAKHYWVGTKLLGKDARIASRLVYKILRGKQLSRRERQQLTRTTADIFRLVPMLVFVVIPFMELLLPVALKLFPNMLPSTFEDKLKKEETMKQRIAARIEVARFLQDTVAEMASDMQRRQSGDSQTSAGELYEFMNRVRAGEPVDPGELLKFAKLFNDELTLDNLERVQLVSLCRFVGIQPFGTDSFLRARLRAHLQAIKEDDRDIQAEGLESLTEDELRQACRARGMRAPYGEGAAAFMRQQLAQWLDWSLNRSLPSSLLLLSRAFTVTSPIGKPSAEVDVSSIRETLSTMPEEVVEDVELFATSDGGDKTEAYERKLELLDREEELIREEQQHEAVVQSALAAEMPATAGRETGQAMAAAAAAMAAVRSAAAGSLAEMLEGESEEERLTKEASNKEAKMRNVLTALAALASSSGVTGEREAFMSLVEKEIERLNSQLVSRNVGKMVFSKGHLAVDRSKVEEALGQQRLEDRVTGLLQRVERELDDVDTQIGSSLRVLDLDNDGVISHDELRTAMGYLKEQLGEEELRGMLERLCAEAGTDGGINVATLMDLALHSQEGERSECKTA